MMKCRVLEGLYKRFLSDRWAFIVVGAYTVSVSLFSYSLGEPHNALRGMYLDELAKVPMLAGLGFVCIAAIKSIRAANPVRRFFGILASALQPKVICGLLLYLALGMFHGSFTAAKTLMEDLAPFAWDDPLARIDAALHGVDAWKIFPLNHGLTRVLQWIYFPVWLFMLAGVSFAVSLFADELLRRQYLITFFFAWIVLGNVVALAFLSGGPVYAEALTGSERFRPPD